MANICRTLIFTGDGKGKTTAALGMAFRASGHKMPIKIIQFMKGDPSTGEMETAQRLEGVELVQTGLGFVPPTTSPTFTEHQNAAHNGLVLAREALKSGVYGLVILDEICTSVSCKLLSEQEVLETMQMASEATCLVLTGRGATAKMIELADTVTEMVPIKHGMCEGWPAQPGVEF